MAIPSLQLICLNTFDGPFSDWEATLQNIYINELEKHVQNQQYYYFRQCFVESDKKCGRSSCVWREEVFPKTTLRCNLCDLCRCRCHCAFEMERDVTNLLHMKKDAFVSQQKK